MGRGLGILKEILFGMLDPWSIMVGIGVGLLWLSQKTSMVAAIVITLILLDLTVFFAQFQVLAAHGMYAYQAQLASAAEMHATPILRPDTIRPEELHQAGIGLAGCILWCLVVYGIGRARRRMKQA